MTRSPSQPARTFFRARVRRPARSAKLAFLNLEAREMPAGVFAVGTDSGGPPRIKVIDSQTLATSFTLSPFPNSFTGGVRVAVGDVNNDGTSDIIATTGPGGGNRVRVFSGVNGNPFNGALGNFQAFTNAHRTASGSRQAT